MPLTIKVRLNGPYAIDLTSGDVLLTDHEGTPIPLPEGKTTIALCRCGASSRKPFCDGTHSKIGFQGAEAARQAFDAAQPPRDGGTGGGSA
jgi:3-phenylpropionate/trans-cinnamate dioxygenase ferredoxin subunit